VVETYFSQTAAQRATSPKGTKLAKANIPKHKGSAVVKTSSLEPKSAQKGNSFATPYFSLSAKSLFNQPQSTKNQDLAKNQSGSENGEDDVASETQDSALSRRRAKNEHKVSNSMGMANKPPNSNYASFLTQSSGVPKGSIKKVTLGGDRVAVFNFKSSIASAKAYGKPQGLPQTAKVKLQGSSNKNSVVLDSASVGSSSTTPQTQKKIVRVGESG
jgi:hypothetical protein